MPNRVHESEKRKVAVVIASIAAALLLASIGATNWFQRDPSASESDSIADGSSYGLSFSSQVKQQPFQPDPFLVLAHSKQSDPSLNAWLKTWNTLHSSGQKMEPTQLEGLKSILEESPLGAVDLLALAHAFHVLSDDSETTFLFYDAASSRVESELNSPGVTAESALPLLMAIEQHMNDYKHVLWPLIDSHKPETAATLFRIYANFVKVGSTSNDPDLVASTTHPAIGASECLYVLGRPNEAWQFLQNYHVTPHSRGEKQGLSWITALIQSQLGDFQTAASCLDDVCSDPSFRYAKSASILQVAMTTRLGKTELADERLDAAIRKYHLTTAEVAPLLVDIQKAKANSQ